MNQFNPEGGIEKTQIGIGSKVECNIKGKKVSGVVFNDDISGGNMVAILLDENIGSNYLDGFGTMLGYDLLNDKNKIEKTGEVSNEELEMILEKVGELSQPK